MDFKEMIPERYRVKYDTAKDCFYVLDTWDPQIKNIADLTHDIPENSPALKIITGTEMNAIIMILKKMGRLEDKIIKPNNNHSTINKDMPIRFPYPKKKFKPRFREDEDARIERVVLRILKKLDRRENDGKNRNYEQRARNY